MSDLRRAAIVGLGEVGRVFARALLDGGVAVRVASRPSQRAEDAAAGLGLELEPATAAVTDAELVLLTIPADGLADVMSAIGQGLAPSALVADCTAASPAQVRAAASGSTCAYVDVAILGAVSLHGAGTPLLAAGPEADRFAAMLDGLGFRVSAMAGSLIGDASGLKLLRSLFAKGLDAVVIESMLAAEAMGLRSSLVEQLADYDRMPLRDHIAMYLRTHPPTAARRLAEMLEAEGQLRALGLPSLTTRAAIERYGRTAELAARSDLPAGLDADASVAWLLRAEREAAGRNGSGPHDG